MSATLFSPFINFFENQNNGDAAPKDDQVFSLRHIWNRSLLFGIKFVTAKLVWLWVNMKNPML